MRVHFIAIGGSVMHQLAISLKKKGYQVTGSDDEIFEPASQNLKNEKLLPETFGWFPEKITGDIDAVILGMHARQDNPELLSAREQNLKIYSFPEYIYHESLDKTRVAIGGSHGKTTTTSMIMHVLQEASQNFDYLVGAKLEGFENSVKISDAPVIILEADEYPASTLEKRPKFHFLFPQIAVLTGIAWDHINVFPTFENYLEQFRIFVDMIPGGGTLIYNSSDEVLNTLIEANRKSGIEYIPYMLPTYFIVDGETSVMINDTKTPLKVFGNHNLLNLVAAHHVCAKLQVSDQQFADAISTFSGAARRLELLGETEGLKIFRDFAHAPSKVKASVDAMKQQYPGARLHAFLELHTFSSLSEQFLSEYAGALNEADEAVVYYSKHALELKRLPPLQNDSIMKGFANEELQVISDRSVLERLLEDAKKQNAIFLFMSSGNFDGLNILQSISL